MSGARARLDSVRAQTHPHAREALAEAQKALAANVAAAHHALSGLVPDVQAATLIAESIDVIATNLVRVLERARESGAKETLLEAVLGYRRCLHEAVTVAHTRDQKGDMAGHLGTCCEKHLGLTHPDCHETAAEIQATLGTLRRELPSQEAYRRVTRALFSEEASWNWARLLSATAVWAATVGLGVYRENETKKQAKRTNEQLRLQYERQLDAAKARAVRSENEVGRSENEADIRLQLSKTMMHTTLEAIGGLTLALAPLGVLGLIFAERRRRHERTESRDYSS